MSLRDLLPEEPVILLGAVAVSALSHEDEATVHYVDEQPLPDVEGRRQI